MTGPENERLAVVETEIKTLRGDVTEMKADVKVLLAARFRVLGVGDLIMRAIPLVALGISIYVAVVR